MESYHNAIPALDSNHSVGGNAHLSFRRLTEYVGISSVSRRDLHPSRFMERFILAVKYEVKGRLSRVT